MTSAVAPTISDVTHVSDEPAQEALPREVAWSIGAAMVAFVVTGAAMRFVDSPIRALCGLIVVAAAGLWLVRADRSRVLPAAALVAVGIGIIGNGTSSNVAWFGICTLAGWCVLLGRRWDGAVFWAGAVVVFGLEWLFMTPDPGWAAWVAGTTFTVLGALLVRHEMRLMLDLRTAQAGLLANARTEERNRIARELHDVIAHSLTVSLLYVTSARVALEHAPAEAAEALETAERIGRETLAEVRGTVGLLREDNPEGIERPQPGAADLNRLAEGFRGAGTNVDVVIRGDSGQVGPTAGLTVYRIAQEALTNAAKHAPGAPVRLALDIADRDITLVVASSGPPRQGTGLGLGSMRERAEAVGGSCVAGPDGQGWVVRALIPVAS